MRICVHVLMTPDCKCVHMHKYLCMHLCGAKRIPVFGEGALLFALPSVMLCFLGLYLGSANTRK